jgi:hypothetical protein
VLNDVIDHLAESAGKHHCAARAHVQVIHRRAPETVEKIEPINASVPNILELGVGWTFAQLKQ